MADQYTISPADLRYIERRLDTVFEGIEVIDSRVDVVNDNVKVVFDRVGALAQDFYDFVFEQRKANRLGIAHTEVVKLRAELEQKYGHLSEIRRTTTGILQADDLGIVKTDTIVTATEELLLSTPNYWLAPCLVALAAWINDSPEIAERALAEGLKRNDEKTSLLFALICRRADRKQASLKWLQRYLANQDEQNLDRKAIVLIDAFASGLLGVDSEGVVSKQIGEWMDRLAEKPGFIEKQKVQWSEAICLKKAPIPENEYPYLRKYSKTWPILNKIMQGARLHAIVFDYFSNIFNQKVSSDSLKFQLDEILSSLVTDFDDEELPIRQKEKYEQFVIDFLGDEDLAQKAMEVEQTAFETHKDFTQLLTDAAMKPESSNASPSTQKFAIALSKEWISEAYNDVTAQNRMRIPEYIDINVDTFNDRTKDGQNEQDLITRFDLLINKETTTALSQHKLTGYEQFCLFGGITIGAVGVLMMLSPGLGFFDFIAAIVGVGMVINHFSKKKKIIEKHKSIREMFAIKLDKGKQIIRALLAEVVDFRKEFSEKDKESEKVVEFIDQITPDQYVAQLANSKRKVSIEG
ncbi:MAG: hypothetical protein GX802_03425 [Clostridiales bacterium]|nr:hypothetical protein [Clostridiales bacterium]